MCYFCSVNVTEDGKKALLTLAQGDMRKALNILQSTSMAYKKVTEDNVYTCVGHPLKSDISNIVKWLLNEEFSAAYKSILTTLVPKLFETEAFSCELKKYKIPTQ